MQRVRRWLTVWIIPLAVIAGSALPVVMYRDRYPDPLAVHWGISGAANGSLPAWLCLLGIFGGLVLAWWGLISGSRIWPNAPLAAVVYFIIGLLAAVNAQILYYNLDAATWEESRDLDVISFGGVLLIAVLAGGLGLLLGGGRGGVPDDVEPATPPTTATSWSGTASNLWIALIAVVPVAAAFLVDPLVAVVLIAVSVLIIVFAFVRVEADEHGVVIALGPVGLPRRKLGMDTITGAGSIEVQPLSYLGWGWRIRSGRRAYVIRGGPAIRIERAKGVATVVTVDDAPTGAAGIENLARARRYG